MGIRTSSEGEVEVIGDAKDEIVGHDDGDNGDKVDEVKEDSDFGLRVSM